MRDRSGGSVFFAFELRHYFVALLDRFGVALDILLLAVSSLFTYDTMFVHCIGGVLSLDVFLLGSGLLIYLAFF